MTLENLWEKLGQISRNKKIKLNKIGNIVAKVDITYYEQFILCNNVCFEWLSAIDVFTSLQVRKGQYQFTLDALLLLHY